MRRHRNLSDIVAVPLAAASLNPLKVSDLLINVRSPQHPPSYRSFNYPCLTRPTSTHRLVNMEAIHLHQELLSNNPLMASHRLILRMLRGAFLLHMTGYMDILRLLTTE